MPSGHDSGFCEFSKITRLISFQPLPLLNVFRFVKVSFSTDKVKTTKMIIILHLHGAKLIKNRFHAVN